VKLGSLWDSLLQTAGDFFWAEDCDICHKRLRWFEFAICQSCLESAFSAILDDKYGLPVFYLGEHRGALQQLIHELKYQARWRLGGVLAGKLAQEAAKHPDYNSWDGVLAVPIHTFRRMKRGYNQADEIARPLSRQLGIPYFSGVLRRVHNTPSQVGKDRAHRLKNVRGAFCCTAPSRVNGRRLLLVDDVTTTGATLGECARALTDAGAASVSCITVASAVLGADI
jgi:competence protein ComFC